MGSSTPILFAFVALGVAIALVPIFISAVGWLISSIANNRRAQMLAVVGAVALTAGGVVVVTQTRHEASAPFGALVVEIPAELKLSAHMKGRPEKIHVDEVLTVTRAAMVDASKSDELRGKISVRDLRAAIRSSLVGGGWTAAPSTLRDRYQHQRAAVKVNDVVPAEKTNILTVSTPSATLERSPAFIDFPISNESEATLIVPERAAGDTFPGVSTRDMRPSSGEDVLSIPLSEDTQSIEFEVRSRPFRNEVLEKLVDLTLLTPLGWLLTTAIVVANESLRELLKRIVPGRRGNAIES